MTSKDNDVMKGVSNNDKDVPMSKQDLQLRYKIKRLLWEIVWAVFFRPTPRWCLNKWRCFLLRLFGARISRGVRINGGARVWKPWNLVVGEGSIIGDHVNLYSVDKIVIGQRVVISEGAYICTASHDVNSARFRLVTNPIVIEDRAWICARAIVLRGVKVHEGAVVAAGAVTSKDVAPWTIIGGNPALFIKKRVLNDDK